MKNLILDLVFLLIPVLCIGKQDDVTGRWYTDNRSGIVEVYVENDICNGRLVWLAEPTDKDGKPYKDALNKDKSLRNRPLIGIYIIKGLKKDGGEWTGGSVYDPESGNTYNCKIKAVDGKLHVRGFIGPFGKTLKWEAAPAAEK